MTGPLIDTDALSAARDTLGPNFDRVVGYLRDDGSQAVTAIEAAMREQNAAALIGPADMLSNHAADLSAAALATLSDSIEAIATDCLEHHDTPTAALPLVIGLRDVFDATLAAPEREPAVRARSVAGFGRRV